jgi:glycosyltransferase involved in cell wall biosynthesis
MPSISVVMPVFNRQDRVAKAVESVLGQELADFELVIVDDASTDRTVEVIQRYDDPRIVLLRQDRNQHAAAARNRGVLAARSELVCFIDSDDEFLPHKLAFVVEHFRNHPELDALIDSFELAYPPDVRRRAAFRINPVLTDSEEILTGIYARRISKATPALTARRAALIAAGLFDPTLPRRQDFDLVVRLARAARCATTDQILWRKHWTHGAITSQVHTFMDAILEMCRRNPAYMTTARYRIGVARDLAHHTVKLVSKRRWRLLWSDLRRFARAYGTATTAILLGQGMIESAKRAWQGTH